MNDQWIPGPPPTPTPPIAGVPEANSWTTAAGCSTSPTSPSITPGVIITGRPATISAAPWAITLNDNGTPPNFTIDHYDSLGQLIDHPLEFSGVDGSANFADPVYLSEDPVADMQAVTKRYVDAHPGVPGPMGPQGDPGPPGPQGPVGPTGPQGAAGQSAIIVGNFGVTQTPATLPPSGLIPADWDAPGSPPAPVQMQAGQALFYTVDEHVWTWVGSSVPSGWIDLGAQQGPQGPQGPVGPQGVQGGQGPQGIQGVAGPQGPVGPLGPAGPAGPQGQQGAPGQTAIIVGSFSNQPTGALPSNGFIPAGWDSPGVPPTSIQMQSGQGLVDTRTQFIWTWVGTAITPSGWLDLGEIQGPPGPAGGQGAQGPPGPTGPAGATGPQGNPGPQGNVGPQGSDGAQGPAGPPGPAGPDGVPGPPGPTGPQGPPGSDAGFPEAPTDGQSYTRRGSDASWQPAAYLPLSGGTLTVPGGVTPLALNGPSSGWRSIAGQSTGSMRWQMYLGDFSGELGGNLGSNFRLSSYTDAGGALASPLVIARQTGVATFSALPSFPGGAPGQALTTNGAGVLSWGSVASGPPVTIGDTAPASPAVGALWWDSVGGQLYVWYADPNTSQWVAASNMGVALSGYLPLTGGTLTGQLTCAAPGGNGLQQLAIKPSSGLAAMTLDSAVGTAHVIEGLSGGSPRWLMYLGDGSETGSNAGANFVLAAYDDTGALIGNALSVIRSNGNVYFGGAINVQASVASQAVGSGNANFVLFNNAGATEGSVYWDAPTGNLYLNRNAGGYLFIDNTGAVNASGIFFAATAIRAGSGYQCKAGTGGAFAGNIFNLNWTGSAMQLWVDNINNGTITVSSDYRIKKDIYPLGGMWATVKALKPISYSLKDFTPPSSDPKTKIAGDPFVKADDKERWGFVAHELQETLIEDAATGVKDAPDLIQSPNPWTVIAALTKALQEAMERIEALEAAR